MNIYLVKRTDPEGLNRSTSVWIGYDEYEGHVIRAETPEHAREIAKTALGDEGIEAWDAPNVEIIYIGIAAGKEAGIVLSSFYAG